MRSIWRSVRAFRLYPIRTAVLATLLSLGSTAACLLLSRNDNFVHSDGIPREGVDGTAVRRWHLSGLLADEPLAVFKSVRARASAGRSSLVWYRSVSTRNGRPTSEIPPSLLYGKDADQVPAALVTIIGWPWPFLYSVQHWNHWHGCWVPIRGTSLPIQSRRHELLFAISDDHVPLVVLWRGALLNLVIALFVARLAFVPLELTRRVYRRRTARCGDCGYPSQATTDRCSECGADTVRWRP